MTRLHVGSLMTIACALWLAPANAQQEREADAAQEEETTITGTVVSSSRNTLVVRTEDKQYQLFSLDRDTQRPATMAAGSRVRVVSTPGSEPGVRVAESVSVLEAAAKPAPGAAPGAAPTEPVPRSVRDLEREIERQAQRWRVGVRAGAGLDPELFLVGVHTQLGPFFIRDVWARPNVEFAFGEVTTLFALNLEGYYRLPISPRQGRWSAYLGAGPNFTFIHQNFERRGGDRDIDFGDFDYSTGFNIFTGVQFRRGTFLEVKTSIYSEPAPTLRLILGYNF